MLVRGPLNRILHTVPASDTRALHGAFEISDPPLQVVYDCETGSETRGRLNVLCNNEGCSACGFLAQHLGCVGQAAWTLQFAMFELASHIPSDVTWSLGRQKAWAGNEIADIATTKSVGGVAYPHRTYMKEYIDMCRFAGSAACAWRFS